jgi:hypothetical protein
VSLLGTVVGGVTGPWRLYVEFAVVAALLTALGAQTVRMDHAQTSEARAEQRLSDERAAATKAALAAETTYRAEESRRAAAQKEITDEAIRMASRARADVAVADAAHGRLSDRAAAVASRCSATFYPPASAGSAPAANPGDLLADVLRRADEAAGELAAFADQAHAAGLACERSYDSLTPTH